MKLNFFFKPFLLGAVCMALLACSAEHKEKDRLLNNQHAAKEATLKCNQDFLNGSDIYQDKTCVALLDIAQDICRDKQADNSDHVMINHHPSLGPSFAGDKWTYKIKINIRDVDCKNRSEEMLAFAIMLYLN